jgi:putative nucleotidyltransferase with HDIG domain
MTLAAKDLINDTLELASLPSVVTSAMQLIDQPGTSASDIGEVIAQDPALSLRLLRIVNSAFYGFPSHIDTISRAITVIGTLELTDLILGSSAIHVFDKLPNELVDMEKFWTHSLYTGVVARILARQLRAPNTERCFVMGLLHDIGSLVMYRQQPERSRQALELAASASIPLHLAERSIFGFDHGEVGAELMQAWKLPETFVSVALNHHQPSAAGRSRLEVTTIHLADVITSETCRTASSGQAIMLEQGSWDITGLSEDSVAGVIAEADSLFEEARSALFPGNRAA